MARHDDLTALTYGETARANNPALFPVYELAAELDMPVSIHSNVGSVWVREPVYLHEIEDAVKAHPKTRFIWCHAGISRRVTVPTLTEEIQRLLSRYKNLWLDLSWVVFENYIAPGGSPDPKWIRLVERFPDRFMIGSDKVARFANLNDEIGKFYVFLDALEPATARKVGRDNFLDVLPRRVRSQLSGN
jgi:predicted TIM-barrel fold metal-dependent hydrolase